jgi:hypothetical protein
MFPWCIGVLPYEEGFFIPSIPLLRQKIQRSLLKEVLNLVLGLVEDVVLLHAHGLGADPHEEGNRHLPRLLVLDRAVGLALGIGPARRRRD